MYHHSFWWYFELIIEGYWQDNSEILSTFNPVYLRQPSSIVEDRSGDEFFEEATYLKALKQLWRLRVLYYKVREVVLKWEFKKELYSLLQILF